MYTSMSIRYFVLLFLITISIGLKAQTTSLSGTVTDNDGAPLIGATVAIKGSSNGVITDVDGKYKISVKAGDVIVLSYVGMKAQEITITDQTTLQVKLQADLISLNEVVVIGYGSVRKSDLTGAVGSVNSKELQKIATPNVLKSLQGQVSGVSIEAANGSQPGGGISIKIRGTGTLTNNLPLYVVDGIIAGDITNINSADIESMEILKDASACAIYGSRAANGVVLISTKKGQSGEMNINFNSYLGVQTPSKYMEMCDLNEYWQVNADVIANSKDAKTPPANDPASKYYADSLNTDWQDLMLRSALIQNYSLSISGGNPNSTYYISGGYAKQDGVLLGTGFNKYTAKINSTSKKGIFSFGENITLISHYRDDETIGPAGRGTVVEMLKMTPNIAPVDSNQLGGYGAVSPSVVGHASKNPYGAAYLLDNHETGYQISANAYTVIDLFKGLKYTLRGGFDLSNTKYISHKPMYDMGTEDCNLSSASLREDLGENKFFIVENLLNFDKEFGDHSFNAVIGYTYQNNIYQSYGLSTSGLPNNEIVQIGAGNSDAAKITSYGIESSLISILGRIIYSYKSKYMLTATFRRDGSSRFSPNSKYGDFPSLSIGWNVHKENFFPKQDVIDVLKIRASWGKLGNQEIGDYKYTGYINSYASYVFGKDQSLVPGATQLAYTPDNLKWEETTSKNLGVDFGFFRSKLTATIDYFDRYTTDMLVWVPIPLSSGSNPASVLRNYGEMESSGLEYSLSYKKNEGSFHYSVTANLTTEKNKIFRLGSNNPLWSGEYENSEGYTQKTIVGGSVSDFYLLHVDGIFQSQDEIDAYNKKYTDKGLTTPQPSAEPGDIRFLDTDSNGIINNADKIYAGSPIPKFTAGLNITADYKGLDFSMFWYSSYGNKVFNGTRFWTESMSTNYNYSKDCLNRWTKDKPSNVMPRAVQGDPNGNTQPSDRWLEDGSYLRLKNIEIGYTIPEAAVNKIKVKSLRFYVSAQNLLTFTDYKGYDPEIGGNADINTKTTSADGVKASRDRGVDRNIYPTAKTFLVGCQLNF